MTDKLLEAKDNKGLVQTKVAEWVDYMLQENPFLLRKIADVDHEGPIDLFTANDVNSFLWSFSDAYFYGIYAPALKEEQPFLRSNLVGFHP